jgi:hypothetical protein
MMMRFYVKRVLRMSLPQAEYIQEKQRNMLPTTLPVLLAKSSVRQTPFQSMASLFLKALA